MQALRQWAKNFALSFYSHKETRRAGRGGYATVFLSFLLTLILLVFGVFAADTLPFGVHFRHADEYRAFIANAFGGEDLSHRIVLTLTDGILSATAPVSGEPVQIDTLADADDAAVYARGNIQLIVDTRAADALDDFEPYYLANDGSGQEITPDEYDTLSDVAKRNFDAKIRYTGRELILTDALTETYRLYLTDAAPDALAKLDESRDADGEEAYRLGVYRLYVKTRFPAVSSYETSSDVPLLRNFYMYNYVNTGKTTDYLMVFSDAVVGAFHTNGGHAVSYYGFYGAGSRTVLTGTETAETAGKAACDFVHDCFYEASPFYLYMWLTGFMQMILYLLIMPLALALLLSSVMRVTGTDPGHGFGTALKEVGSWMWQAALLTVVAVLLLGFALPRRLLQPASLLVLFGVLFVRGILCFVHTRQHPETPVSAPVKHYIPDEDKEV